MNLDLRQCGWPGRWWLAICLVLAALFAGKGLWGMSVRPLALVRMALGA